MRRTLALICALWITAASFSPVKKMQFRVPQGWPQPAYDFKKNPLSKDKILLGRALFYDPILSADSTISCVSCHLQYSGFTHVDHKLSHGIAGRQGNRNSPALMNMAWGRLFMWDGAINHLDMQPLAPIAHPDEMGFGIDSVVLRLNRSPRYQALFYNAWHDSSATGEYFLKSISQFMLTIVSANSKYDRAMRKEDGAAFTPQEENGLRLFRQHCAACHKEPLFTTNEFANNGLPVDTTLNDYGRIRMTHMAGDSLLFKIPTLRNIEVSYPYMHDGRFTKLKEVIAHYTGGITRGPTLSAALQKPIVLTPNERVDLIAFLLTLTDKDFLFNAEYSFPKEIFQD